MANSVTQATCNEYPLLKATRSFEARFKASTNPKCGESRHIRPDLLKVREPRGWARQPTARATSTASALPFDQFSEVHVGGAQVIVEFEDSAILPVYGRRMIPRLYPFSGEYLQCGWAETQATQLLEFQATILQKKRNHGILRINPLGRNELLEKQGPKAQVSAVFRSMSMKINPEAVNTQIFNTQAIGSTYGLDEHRVQGACISFFIERFPIWDFVNDTFRVLGPHLWFKQAYLPKAEEFSTIRTATELCYERKSCVFSGIFKLRQTEVTSFTS